MFDPSSFVNPTPLAHADTSMDVLPSGSTSQSAALLARQRRKGFLHRIVTGDEKWVRYDNPKRRKSWGCFHVDAQTEYSRFRGHAQ
ncbi:hypothetical protein TNCV_3041061 [Trichonephila clavipes]|nr:hypothetical protein TNCV_3041061 [Trichonephila clavipes]